MTLLVPETHERLHKTTLDLACTKVVDAKTGVVQAIVNVSGNRDSDGDIVVPGASAYGLALTKPKVVWSHDWKTPIGKTIDGTTEVFPGDKSLPQKLLDLGLGGLRMQMQFNMETQGGKDAYSNVSFFGDEQQWSVGYEVHEYFNGGGGQAVADDAIESVLSIANAAYAARMKDAMADAEPSRFITKWIVYEGSPVLFGANRLAQTENVKDATADEIERIVIKVLNDRAEVEPPEPEGEPEPEPEPSKALDDIEIGVAYFAGEVADDKAGRVLSSANVTRLRAVQEAIAALLSGAGIADETSDAEDDGEPKGDPPTPHAFAADTEHPHRCSVCGAGAQRPWHTETSAHATIDAKSLMEFQMIAVRT